MPTGMTRSGHVAAQRRLRRDDAPSARGATSITFCLRVYGSVLLGFFFVVKAWSYGAHWVKIESVERWGIVPVRRSLGRRWTNYTLKKRRVLR